MEHLVTFLEDVVHYTAEIGILLVELAGIAVLLYTAIKGVYMFLRKDPLLRLRLAEGITLALEFKLGGEVLRTVLIRGWNETAILAATIVLRTALTLLLHWEIKLEKHDLSLELEMKKG